MRIRHLCFSFKDRNGTCPIKASIALPGKPCLSKRANSFKVLAADYIVSIVGQSACANHDSICLLSDRKPGASRRYGRNSEEALL